MKISFDKALLWSLPYLYLVAIFYYWGYWGTFEIDAINYYPISDLVKGVTARLASTLLWTTISFLLYAAYWLFLDSGWAKNNPHILRRMFIGLACLCAALVILVLVLFKMTSPSLPVDQSSKPFFQQTLAGALPFLVAVLISFSLETYYIVKKGMRANSLRVLTFLYMVWLPCNSFVSGKKAAWAVIENKDFDYIVMRGGVMEDGIYKYLGKAGESLFFVTLDNSKHIVATAASINPIVVEHYLNDRASQRRFRINLRRLISAKPAAPARTISMQVVH
jgi:hypothetical protein